MTVTIEDRWRGDGGEYRMQCDGGCHKRHPRGSHDARSMVALARADGWVAYGKRDLCPECRHKASQQALRELGKQQARRRSGQRPRP